jgi:FkbM family methyltransferase
MTTISYAQNYEDIMLLRALAGVERGFYIDVGAQDPIGDSVTKAFYERGWHGINIEPVTHWFQRLQADRPHDINLQLAVSDSPGQLHLFEVQGSGLSTVDPEFAKRHADAGYQIIESDVQCVTLDALCQQYRVDTVHFLKIDCEGAEAAALRGLSLDKVRPWIILLEATEPNSQRPAYAEWEPLLTDRGYRFAYADGLNRFYVADEQEHLLAAFAFPPNVFDRFIRSGEAMAQRRAGEMEERLGWATSAQLLSEAQARVSALEQRIAQGEALHVTLQEQLNERDARLAAANQTLGQVDREIAQLYETIEQRDRDIAGMFESSLHGEVARLQVQLQAAEVARKDMLQSTSWRVTAPIRQLKLGVRGLVSFGYRTAFRVVRRMAHLGRPMLRRLAASEGLRSAIVGVLGQDSRWVIKARAFLFGVPLIPVAAMGGDVPLTRSAERILKALSNVRDATSSWTRGN